MNLHRVAAVLLLALTATACHRGKNENEKVEVKLGAAASLRVVLPELIKEFNKDHKRPTIVPMYGASGDLRKRVQDGAPIDAVLFAAAEPVDQLIKSGHVIDETRKVIAHNQLVLVGSKRGPRLTWDTIEQLPDGEKLAIGEPEVVPAGTYAKKALTALKKWDAVQGKLVFGGDVAAVLAYVRRGEVAAGIVYATELTGSDEVVVLEEAKGDWAPRADVVVGAVKDVDGASHSGPARNFVDFLTTPEAKAIFKSKGFEIDG